MKTILRLALLVAPIFFFASCGGEPPEVSSTEEASKVCPYLVPFCDASAGCKLVGGCPSQCVCPGYTHCADGSKCPKGDLCCPGTVSPTGSTNYTCYNGPVCIF
jgi:hypothetical protein